VIERVSAHDIDRAPEDLLEIDRESRRLGVTSGFSRFNEEIYVALGGFSPVIVIVAEHEADGRIEKFNDWLSDIHARVRGRGSRQLIAQRIPKRPDISSGHPQKIPVGSRSISFSSAVSDFPTR
jgi:hypothetical protein